MSTIVAPCACGKTFRTTAANAGKRARCPACGTVIRIPPAEVPKPVERGEPPVMVITPVQGLSTGAAGLALVILSMVSLIQLGAVERGRGLARDLDLAVSELIGFGNPDNLPVWALALGGGLLGCVGFLICLRAIARRDGDTPGFAGMVLFGLKVLLILFRRLG